MLLFFFDLEIVDDDSTLVQEDTTPTKTQLSMSVGEKDAVRSIDCSTLEETDSCDQKQAIPPYDSSCSGTIDQYIEEEEADSTDDRNAVVHMLTTDDMKRQNVGKTLTLIGHGSQ